MSRLYSPLALLASLFLGCGSYYEMNNFFAEKCGNNYYDIATQLCQNSKIYDKHVTKGEFIDSRDGRAYKYVTIGAQTWMAENLRYETPNTKCYDDNPDNCNIYGPLYDWDTAKEACPLGWHLPSDDEWFTLRGSLGSSHEGVKPDNKLMANSVLWTSGKGTDEFSFAALPGGYYRFEGYFLNINEGAVFWSTTKGSIAGSAHVHHISPLSWVREIDGLYTDNSWVNVRCIKDI